MIIVNQWKSIFLLKTTSLLKVIRVDDKVLSLLDVIGLAFWKKNWYS